jgi:nitrate reductase gamma subunit
MYKTLYYPSTNFEYQKRGSHWVYRVKDSKADWQLLPPDRAKNLNIMYSNNALFFYGNTFKIGVLAIVIGIGAYSYLCLKKNNALPKK